jgi:phage terminase Nu1 subunit (DNA packaging protein)
VSENTAEFAWVERQAEVAAHFGVSTRTVREWLAAGCPGVPGNYDLAAIAAWRKSRAEMADVAMMGGSSPALERFRLARAQREEFALERDRGQWLRREEVHDGLALLAGVVRQAAETIQKQFGPEAHQILSEAIEDGLRAFERRFADPAGVPMGYAADPATADPGDS